MRTSDLPQPRFLLLPLYCLLFSIFAGAQTQPTQNRIVDRVNDNTLTTLRGNTHPLAQARFDQGIAPPDLPMSRMLLVLKRSDAQESALQSLLDAQQDPSSPSYHQWLTPDAFGQQFGPSDTDVQTIAAWLGSHGFQIGAISRGRTVIEFSGTAAQVQQAFHTEIHKFVVNGETHWANAGEPQIPSALAPVIVGINSLHNFYKKPAHHIGGVYSKSRTTGEVKAMQPGYTLGGVSSCSATGACYFVGPYDFAKIYNVLPLWSASPAIDGTGQSIAILGRSDIVLQDVRDFRNLFGLPANDPTFLLNGADPGIVSGDETEATLDVEWSGAVAKGAKISLVISGSSETADGIDLSAVYAVENNVAPVVNESFGLCELFLGAAGNSFQNSIRQQAAAQGITFVTSTGDQGAAGCDSGDGNSPEPASHGLTVSGLASSPYGVAVGGTDLLNYGPNYTVSSLNAPSPYWNTTNDANHASARGYIPEGTWNDTCTNNIFVVYSYGATAEAGCNNSRALNWVNTVAGSGGKSSCINSNGSTASSCSGGYAKPSWQSAPGVPADGARDVPDVSLFAGNGFFGSAYIVCEADQTQTRGTCALTGEQYDFVGIGGTSAASPAFAGIVALVNQYTQSAGQGNANHVLYKLAASTAQRSANCSSSAIPASGCIFNDVTSGTIATPCAAGSLNCTVSLGSDTYGILSGYNAAVGYDLATGLGSVNAFNLVHNWGTPGISTSTSLSLNSGSAVSITHGQSVPFSIAVTPGAATGNVSLVGSSTAGSSIALGSFLTLQNGAVSGTTSALAGGTSYQVMAHYAGDTVYAPSDSTPVTVTVAPEPSKTLISIPVFDPVTNLEIADNPSTVVYGSPYTERIDVGNAGAALSFPMKTVCAQSACPTGTVTITDSLNGAAQIPLGGGAYPLNDEGFAEYFSIQLAGGAHQLSASYVGDNSYKPSTGIYSLLVTPAVTAAGATGVPSSTIAGTPTILSANFTTTVFNGAVPTGTVTFYDGATQLSGNVSINAQGGNTTATSALFTTLITTFSTSGSHSITAHYSGDSNYASATSAPATIPVYYPTATSANSNPTVVNLGQSVTVTATATSSYKGTAMTGTFQFTSNFSPSGSPVTPTLTTDGNGNQVLTATFTTTPASSEFISVSYSGDANFEASSSQVYIALNIPDFRLNVPPNPFVITAGQSGTLSIAVAPSSGMASSVSVSCSGAIPIGYNCGVSPSTVNLSNSTNSSFVLSLTPVATGAATAAHRSVAAIRFQKFPMNPGGLVSIGLFSGLAGLALFLAPGKPLRVRLVTRAISVSLACLALGCSGGAPSSGGGGVTQPTAKPTVTTLTTSAAKVPQYSPVTLTATVSGNGTATGSVTFYFGANNQGSGTLVGNVASFTTTAYNPGIVTVTAQYSGDSLNSSSSSAPLTEAVTGNATVLVEGQTSSLSHVAEVNVSLQ